MTRRTGSALTAALAAVGAAALWGTTGTAQALGPDASGPAAVGALRVVVGAAVLVLLTWRDQVRWSSGEEAPVSRPGLVTRRRDLALLLVGGLAVAAYQVSFFLAVARTGVAVGTVVALGVAPLATGLLGLLLGERPGLPWGLATAGAVTGVVLLVAGDGGFGVDGLGVAAAVGAGVSYAGYTVAARSLLVRGAPGMAVMAGIFVVGAVVLAPVLFVADLRWLTSTSGLVMVLWLGVVATGVSYVLFQHGLGGLPAGTVATLSLAEPVTATLLGVLVLGEHLSPLTAVGIGVVVLSLLLMTVRRRTRPAVPEPV
ncbi:MULTISPECIES: DMT family transporter [unclassified Ornithinimicrobium]|uniref:DMT family transporter n=1 Tax=unclassified Ornithinimicrobium TaxID=2615080 RepID=UPI003852A355